MKIKFNKGLTSHFIYLFIVLFSLSASLLVLNCVFFAEKNYSILSELNDNLSGNDFYTIQLGKEKMNESVDPQKFIDSTIYFNEEYAGNVCAYQINRNDFQYSFAENEKVTYKVSISNFPIPSISSVKGMYRSKFHLLSYLDDESIQALSSDEKIMIDYSSAVDFTHYLGTDNYPDAIGRKIYLTCNGERKGYTVIGIYDNRRDDLGTTVLNSYFFRNYGTTFFTEYNPDLDVKYDTNIVFYHHVQNFKKCYANIRPFLNYFNYKYFIPDLICNRNSKINGIEFAQFYNEYKNIFSNPPFLYKISRVFCIVLTMFLIVLLATTFKDYIDYIIKEKNNSFIWLILFMVVSFALIVFLNLILNKFLFSFTVKGFTYLSLQTISSTIHSVLILAFGIFNTLYYFAHKKIYSALDRYNNSEFYISYKDSIEELIEEKNNGK